MIFGTLQRHPLVKLTNSAAAQAGGGARTGWNELPVLEELGVD
jgi:hypothetical protein